MRRYTFRIVICSSERTIEILGGDKGAAPSRRSKTKDKIALVFARWAPCRSGPYVTNCRSCSVNDIHSGDAEKSGMAVCRDYSEIRLRFDHPGRHLRA